MIRRPPRSTLFPYTTLFRSPDLFVPAGHWHLRSQDHRARLVAILGDLPEVSPLRFRHRGHDPVIDDQNIRSEEHTSELQSRSDLVCRLLLEKKKKKKTA